MAMSWPIYQLKMSSISWRVVAKVVWAMRVLPPAPIEEGEQGIRILELKLMADVGLLGLPNAGKSTLLSRISNARPKIADYPFTTLKPKLGQVFMDDGDGFVVADIPGLIEGAHEGKGLGARFLRHIERTAVLLHLVDSFCLEGKTITEQIHEIEAERNDYGDELWHKHRLLVLNKMDALTDDQRQAAMAEVSAMDLPVYAISAVSGEGISILLRRIYTQVLDMREQSQIEGETEDGDLIADEGTEKQLEE